MPHYDIYMRYFWSLFFFSSRRRHTRFDCDWSSDVCSSDLSTTKPLCSWTTGLVGALTREALRVTPQIRRRARRRHPRSEEHTSELQSQSNLVCRLLLEKKKKKRR